jgi:apolipoprotein D and lipocalin family protein
MIRSFTLAAVAGITFLTLNSCATIPSGIEAIKPFDKVKYLGRWYEIARFDFRFERNLNNVTATYSLNRNGTIKVVNRGYDYVSGEWKEAIGKAKSAGDADEAKLKVSFFGPFYAGYNVIAIDNDYNYALIAGQNFKYLWLLSRETTMPDSVKESYLKIAQEAGYDVSALLWTLHDNTPDAR